MNDKTKRSLRRYHRARKQRQAARVLREWYHYSLTGHFWGDGWREPTMTEEEFHARVSKHRDNLAICSCSGCRNPRTSMWGCYDDRITMQERINNDRYYEGLQEAVVYLHDRKYGDDSQE